MEENPVRTRTPAHLHSSGIGRRQISEGSTVNQGRAGTVNQEEQVPTQPQQRKGAHAAWDARTVFFPVLGFQDLFRVGNKIIQKICNRSIKRLG
jgi:hypothetical protein